MTNAYFTATGHRSAGVAGYACSILAALQRLWHALRDWRERRATVTLLQSLDRRTLKDIGIERQEIESLVYGGSDRRLRFGTHRHR